MQLLDRGVYFVNKYKAGIDKLELKQLSCYRGNFYANLKDEDITQGEFDFAQKVFKDVNWQSIRDYLKIYILSDVFLLAEFFQEFRKEMHDVFSLDPSYHSTIILITICIF